MSGSVRRPFGSSHSSWRPTAVWSITLTVVAVPREMAQRQEAIDLTKSPQPMSLAEEEELERRRLVSGSWLTPLVERRDARSFALSLRGRRRSSGRKSIGHAPVAERSL